MPSSSRADAVAVAPRRALRTSAERSPLLGRPLTRTAGVIVALALLAVCVVASVAYGSAEMSLGTVASAFTDFDGSREHIIIRELRVPRTLIGVGVGAALGLAGALMQGVTRNPLAEPGILGINAGAALAVVLAIYTLGITTASGYVWFAFLGAGVAAVVVYALGAGGRGGATPIKLALAGTVLAFLCSALTYAVLVLDVDTLNTYRFWMVGSLAGRDMDIFLDVLPFLGVGAVIALAAGRALNALSLGEDVARSLGQRVAVTRGMAALAVVLLAGASVAAAGPIVFLGLAVPHIVRMIVGGDWRWVLVYSAIAGPILLLASDVLGRVVARPAELEVGIVTALLGAPLFIALARRRRLAIL